MVVRQEIVGIKQPLRLEWMQKTVDLMELGLDASTIRQELHEYLAYRNGDGSLGSRGRTSRSQAVNMLMKIWVTPESEVGDFRDIALAFLRGHPSLSLPVYWAMISAVYPFWFNVARQTGRLLFLQDQVRQVQLLSRLKEQYGDRKTVSRASQRTIRSFIAWGTLKDSVAKGCYERTVPMSVTDVDLAILMVESALLTTADAKATLVSVQNDPAFFPFRLPVLSGDVIAQRSDHIGVFRNGIDSEILELRS